MSSAVELVVTDLDGTLSDAGERIHPKTVRAVLALGSAGIPVLVATGRRPRTAALVLESAGLRGPAVMLDGSIGRDLRDGRAFHRAAFSPEAAATVLDTFTAGGLQPCVHVERPGVDIVVGDRPSAHPGHLARAARWVAREDLSRIVRTEPVLSFTVVGGDHFELGRVGSAIVAGGVGSASVTPDLLYGGSTLQVRPLGVSKWSGVLAFCGDQGLDATRVLAVGDGANDVELLGAASVACVVAGGSPAALAHADHLIDPPSRGGWAAILDLVRPGSDWC
ncbi:MAG TPA: HAD family hydrolase [Actinomycetes bacterium]|jgi:hydroxymethylpyrimidine pyrophosphatase-like HAD family hydrolase|nr:HAD family hydrolase [Actinomycetes bacterium]